MQPLPPDTPLRASTDCVVRDVLGDIVLLNLRNGAYYGLDETGAEIWDMLQNGADLQTLTDTLHMRSGEDRARINADLLTFLSDMLEHKLIDIHDPGE